MLWYLRTRRSSTSISRDKTTVVIDYPANGVIDQFQAKGSDHDISIFMGHAVKKTRRRVLEVLRNAMIDFVDNFLTVTDRRIRASLLSADRCLLYLDGDPQSTTSQGSNAVVQFQWKIYSIRLYASTARRVESGLYSTLLTGLRYTTEHDVSRLPRTSTGMYHE